MNLISLKKRLKQLLSLPAVLLLKIFYAKPDVIISFGVSLGDEMLCTIVAQQLKKKGYKKIWILTCFPEIFVNNPHINKAVKKDMNGNVSALMKKYLKGINANIIHLLYGSYNKISDRDERIPEKHIAHLMCDIANVSYPEILRPNFYLTDMEKQKGKLYDNQICIQSTGKGARHYMQNKDWYPERFEEVVGALKDKYNIIQIGSANDYSLPYVIDMRGKTSIRETAALLASSKFFIGLDGFPMHLARSVNCKSVIIYGGRARPDQTGYECNINLYSPVSCSPCWYWNFCPNDRMCMKEITAKDVIKAVECVSDIENGIGIESKNIQYNDAI